MYNIGMCLAVFTNKSNLFYHVVIFENITLNIKNYTTG